MNEKLSKKQGEENKTLRVAVENKSNAVRLAMLSHRRDP